MSTQKYTLTNISITFNSRTLYKIKALRSFSNVRAGDLGGYIQSESNLSHDGDCWVYNNAKVYGRAEIYGNAQVLMSAVVSDNAQIYGDAIVHGTVSDNAKVYGNAIIEGKVCDNASVYDNAKVLNGVVVFERAQISGNTSVTYNTTGNKLINLICKYIHPYMSNANRNSIINLNKPITIPAIGGGIGFILGAIIAGGIGGLIVGGIGAGIGALVSKQLLKK